MSKRHIPKHFSQPGKISRSSLICNVCGKIFKSHRALSTHTQLSDRCRTVMKYASALPPEMQYLKASCNGKDVNLDPTSPAIPYQYGDSLPSNFVNDVFDTHDEDLPNSNESPTNNNIPGDQNTTGVPPPSHGFCFSNDLLMSVELMFLLKNAGCPLYLFDDILTWVKNAVSRGVSFSGKLPKREAVLKLLEKRFHTTACRPQTVDFALEGGGSSSVVIFNTKAMIESLLNDKRLMSEQHMVVSKANPSEYQPQYATGSKLDEIHQGSACRDSQAALCTAPRDVFCGIILYTDSTVLGPFSSGKLEPVMMSLSLFSRKTRYQSYAWRPIGYIDRPKGQLSDAVNGTDAQVVVNKGMSTRNYHRALELILSSLKKLQDNGGLRTDLCIDGVVHKDMLLKVPIVTVLCDCEGADDLCGRYKSHSGHVNSLCRDCDCLTADADNFNIQCHPRMRSDFVNASDNDLQRMSHYRLDNTFDKLQMCDTAEGISGCTPPDMLHHFDAGVIKNACKFFYDNVLKKNSIAQHAFDSVLSQVSRQCQHQSDRKNMPIITFNHGYAKLVSSVIKSSEYTGLMVCCVLTWHTHAAQVALHGKTYEVIRDHITSFINLFEMLLCLQNWMKTAVFDVNTIDDNEASFRKVMETYKKTVLRTEGLGLKTTKFHQMSHIIRYIKKFGSPQNFNTARNENHHKVHAKNPAQRTQKRHKTLSKQTSIRFYENYVIDVSQSYINLNFWKAKPTVIFPDFCVEGTKCWVKVKDIQPNLLSLDIDFKQYVPFDFQKNLLSFLSSVVLNNTPDIPVLCFTECHINNIRYRAHPSYRSDRPWNDWCYYKTSRMQYDRIANIQLFVLVDNVLHQRTGLTAGVYAVAHCSTEHPQEVSVLVRSCHLNTDDTGTPIYHLISVQDITGPAFCIKNLVRKENSVYTSEDLSQIFVLDSQESWKNNF